MLSKAADGDEALATIHTDRTNMNLIKKDIEINQIKN